MHKKLIALISATILISSSLIGCVGSKSESNKVINVFNCGDYIDEELITKFEEETGYKVEYSTYDTNEIMYSKIKSGSNKYDLVFPSDYMIEKMINEGMAEKINFVEFPDFFASLGFLHRDLFIPSKCSRNAQFFNCSF